MIKEIFQGLMGLPNLMNENKWLKVRVELLEHALSQKVTEQVFYAERSLETIELLQEENRLLVGMIESQKWEKN